ncbi:hypothetical protein D9M68_424150 [compost metagenome]
MTRLISKVQFKRSEKGEFHEIKKRSLDDTISLLLNYPWDTERSLASVELTCPSITIEHPTGTFLKVAPYFSGKFSLYYRDTNKKVYLKVVKTIEEACSWVHAYFGQEGKLKGFDKYGFTINSIAHFRTRSFEYTVNLKAAVVFFRFPLLLIPLTLLLCSLNFLDHPERFNLSLILAMSLLVLFLSSPIIYFFFNYLSVDKNSYLRVSKGHDEFVYGTADSKKVYNKQDITEINRYLTHATRSPWNDCEVFTIIFKNGQRIRFTSLLISGQKFAQKFPDHTIVYNRRFFPIVQSV